MSLFGSRAMVSALTAGLMFLASLGQSHAESDAEHAVFDTKSTRTLAPRQAKLKSDQPPPIPAGEVFAPFAATNDPWLVPGGTGRMPGSWGVSADGEATYSVPLWVPDGRAGMQPSLSLDYGSRGDNGIVGMGWELSGALSAVTRCDKNTAADSRRDGVEFRDYITGDQWPQSLGNDHYCLDGQKLVALSGEYGAHGTVYSTRVESGLRITSYNATGDSNGPEQFVVESQNGTRTYDAVLANRSDPVVEPPKRLMWTLTSETNRFGDSVHYEYSTVGYKVGVDLHPTKITYTHGPDRLHQAQRTVEFKYEQRPDQWVGWKWGVRQVSTQRLKAIHLKAPNPVASSEVGWYELEYEPSSRTQRSLLSAVRYCVNTGTDLSGKTCLKRKQFDYVDSPVAQFEEVAAPFEAPGFQYDWLHARLHIADFDGDGTNDVLFYRTTTNVYELHMGTRWADGTVGALSETYNIPINTVQGASKRSTPTDLDSDGRAELFVVKQSTIEESQNPLDPWQRLECETYLRRWNDATKQFEGGSTGLAPYECSLPHAHTMFADANGDGLVDVFVSSDDPSTDGGRNEGPYVGAGEFKLHLNGGPPGQPYAQGYATGVNAHLRSYVTDSRRSGRERLGVGASLVGVNELGFMSHEVIPGPYWQSSSDSQVEAEAAPEFADLNGDGLPDMLYLELGETGCYNDEYYTRFDAESKDGLVENPTRTVPLVVRWNTGNGFLPPQTLTQTLTVNLNEGVVARCEFDLRMTNFGIRLFDLNRDGMTDVVRFEPSGTDTTQIRALLSNGDGTFTDTIVSSDAGEQKPGSGTFLAYYNDQGRWESYWSDFDGDGFVDLWRNALGKTWMRQVPTYHSRLQTVSDEGTLWSNQEFTYSTRWSDKPEPQEACTFPLRCMTQGPIVVRRVDDWTHLVDPASFTEIANSARSFSYSYQDPVLNLQTGGWSFGKRIVFDASRPQQTVVTYDNRTADPNAPYVFPYRSAPKSVEVSTPILTPEQWANRTTVTGATARLERTTFERERKTYRNGLTSRVEEKGSTHTEWEQYVAIDWDALNPWSLNPTALHVWYAADGSEPPLRRSHRTSTTDAHGNPASVVSSIEGGVSSTVIYDYYTGPQYEQAWQLSLLKTSTTHRWDGGDQFTVQSDFTYTDEGLLETSELRETNPDLWNRSTFGYDPYGLLIRRTVEAGATGQPVTARTVHTARDPVFVGAPDERIYVSQVWQDGAALPHSAWLAYHPALGVPLASMDANGVQSQAKYTYFGQVAEQRADGAPPVQRDYALRADAFGGYNGMQLTTTVVDPLNPTPLGRSRVFTGGQGQTVLSLGQRFGSSFLDTAVVAKHDILGRTTEVSRAFDWPGAAQHFARYEYDSLNRLAKTIRPDNTFARSEYDFDQVTAWDAENNRSQRVFDINGRLKQSTDYLKVPGAPDEAITTGYAYTAAKITVTTPDGAQHVNHIDKLSRMTRQDHPDTGSVVLAYTGFGELRHTRHLGSGATRDYIYDALGRLITSTTNQGTPEAAVTLLDYDGQTAADHAIGKLWKAQSPDGVETFNSYNALGQATGQRTTLGGEVFNTALEYDPTYGWLDAMLYPSSTGGADHGLRVLYGRNAQGDVTSISYDLPNEQGVPAQRLWQVHERNREGGLLLGGYGVDPMNPFEDAVEATRAYEPVMGRLQQLRARRLINTQTDLLNLTYGYDDAGRVSHRNDALADRLEQFDYDSLGRLTNWDVLGATPSAVEYRYAPNGNLLQEWALNPQTQQMELAVQNYYGKSVSPDPFVPKDQPRTLTQREEGGLHTQYFYDVRGRQTSGAGRSIDYTEFDLPKTLTKGADTWHFKYDGFGNRTEKRNVKVVGGITTTTIGGLFERRKGLDSNGQQQTRYEYKVPLTDGGMAEVIIDASLSPSRHVEYTLTDALNSTSKVINAAGEVIITDNLKQEYRTTPFGALLGSYVIANQDEIFTGLKTEELDYGLINMKGRMYDPKLGRFLSADPVLHPSLGQSFNPYSYVLNDPINRVDPTGFDGTYDRKTGRYTGTYTFPDDHLKVSMSAGALSTVSTVLVMPTVTIVGTPPAVPTRPGAPVSSTPGTATRALGSDPSFHNTWMLMQQQSAINLQDLDITDGHVRESNPSTPREAQTQGRPKPRDSVADVGRPAQKFEGTEEAPFRRMPLPVGPHAQPPSAPQPCVGCGSQNDHIGSSNGILTGGACAGAALIVGGGGCVGIYLDPMHGDVGLYAKGAFSYGLGAGVGPEVGAEKNLGPDIKTGKEILDGRDVEHAAFGVSVSRPDDAPVGSPGWNKRNAWSASEPSVGATVSTTWTVATPGVIETLINGVNGLLQDLGIQEECVGQVCTLPLWKQSVDWSELRERASHHAY